jgi:hypothetical protein
MSTTIAGSMVSTVATFFILVLSTQIAHSEICLEDDPLGLEGLVVAVTGSSDLLILTDKKLHQRPPIATVSGGFDNIEPSLLRVLTGGRRVKCGNMQYSWDDSRSDQTIRTGDDAIVAVGCCFFDVGSPSSDVISEFMSISDMIKLIEN